jgi:hypothetical protein
MHTRRLILAAALVVVGAGGCSKSADKPTSAEGSYNAIAAPAEVYTVRGVVTGLPVGEDPRASLRIHHEHIPDFKGKDGEVYMNDDGVPGMKAMEMPFDTLGPNVVLEGIEVGDKIEFDLAIAREPRTTFAITRIVELPPDTEISFDNKTPPNDPNEPLP